jgi:MFS family permease
MNPRRLFVASCIALVASAFSFVTRGDILPALGFTFNLNQESRGAISGAAFYGMAISMFVGAPICDALGLKRMLGLAFLCHIVGSTLTVGSPYLVPQGSSTVAFYVLWAAMFLVGSANGFVEIGINPLTATIYSKEKTHMLNVLHAWWPGGLFIGGFLASILINTIMGLAYDGIALASAPEGAPAAAEKILLGWQIKAGLVFIPTLIYGALFVFEKFPVTERVASGVSSRAMYMEVFRPMFILWAVCMLMTASVELGPQQWQNSVLTKTSNISGTYILMYTSAIMFVLRHFAGPIAHRISPVGLLTGSAALTAVGLYLLSFADSTFTAFTYATIYGLGIVYFWPTMLGVTAERFPRGGAFLLGLMGCVGNLAVAMILPVMGGFYDRGTLAALPEDLRPLVVASPASGATAGEAGKVDEEKLKALEKTHPAEAKVAVIAGARQAFRKVAPVPVVLFVVFAAIAISHHLRGGYKPEQLQGEEFTPAELASDF